MVLPSLRSSHVWIAHTQTLASGSMKSGASQGSCARHARSGASGKKVPGDNSTDP
jgi:hypothetical protein